MKFQPNDIKILTFLYENGSRYTATALSEGSGVPRTSVRRRLDILIQKGYVESIYGGAGQWLYRIALHVKPASFDYVPSDSAVSSWANTMLHLYPDCPILKKIASEYEARIAPPASA